MNKIPIGIDLIAGILLGIDLFAPKWGNGLGNWIIKRLPDSDEARNPLNRKTIIFNSTIAFYIFSLFIILAMSKDTGSYTLVQTWGSIGLYATGSFSGAIIITIMALVISKYVNLFQSLTNLINNKLLRRNVVPKSDAERNQSTIYITWIASFILTILLLSIITFLIPTYPFILLILLSSIYVVVLLPVSMMYAPSFRKFIDSPPKKRIYVTTRIGLILFVSSKLIQIFT